VNSIRFVRQFRFHIDFVSVQESDSFDFVLYKLDEARCFGKPKFTQHLFKSYSLVVVFCLLNYLLCKNALIPDNLVNFLGFKIARLTILRALSQSQVFHSESILQNQHLKKSVQYL
jgi:hypothetical protein